MLSFLIISFVCVVYGIFHSLLASLRFKNWLQRQLGDGVFRWYRLIYNFISMVTFLPILALLAWLPDRHLYSIPFPWVLVSGLLQLTAVVVLGIGLMQSGLISFLGLDAFQAREQQTQGSLNLKGLYAYVRHPIYTAGLVFLWLTPVMTQNLFAFNLSMSIYIFVGAWLEERKMVAQFGDVYREYQQRVPMFLPRRQVE